MLELNDEVRQFLAENNTYDFYFSVWKQVEARNFISGPQSDAMERDFQFWKKYPNTPELEPGRRSLYGTVLKVDMAIDQWGEHFRAEVLLQDNNRVYTRVPKSLVWKPDDRVSFIGTVNPSSKNCGIVANPRKIVQ